MTDDQLVFEREVDESRHEREVHARARRVVRERTDQDARLHLGALPGGDQSREEVVARIVRRGTGVEHRHRDDRRAGEARTGQVDRIARTRHQRAVAGTEQHPHEVRETLLGADGRDDFGVGVEVDVEERLVARGHGETEIGDAARGAVAVVARVVRRLGELRDGDVGTGQVGIAETEVDDVATRGARASAFSPLICAKT